MIRFRRIMHATDFSKASQRAFGMAVGIAQLNRAELVLLHVLTPITSALIGDHYTDPSLYAQMDSDAQRSAQSAISGLKRKAEKARVKVKTLLLRGTAAEQIVRAARRPRADLIVIGTHGRTGLSKLLLGSVAGRVVSTASCPVMTVRAQ